jgi:hypothetical protein
MTDAHDPRAADDPHDLSRFVRAQDAGYAQALSELRAGLKQSHWMWWIFPQLHGLAASPTSTYYSIKSQSEAKAYLDHPVLGRDSWNAPRRSSRGRGPVSGGDTRLARRSEATLLRDVVCVGVVSGFSVRSVTRQVLSPRARQQNAPVGGPRGLSDLHFAVEAHASAFA